MHLPTTPHFEVHDMGVEAHPALLAGDVGIGVHGQDYITAMFILTKHRPYGQIQLHTTHRTFRTIDDFTTEPLEDYRLRVTVGEMLGSEDLVDPEDQVLNFGVVVSLYAALHHPPHWRDNNPDH